jgi:hypothetical protein
MPTTARCGPLLHHLERLRGLPQEEPQLALSIAGLLHLGTQEGHL